MQVALIFPDAGTVRTTYKELIWLAARTCYSERTPQNLWAQIQSGQVSEPAMLRTVRHVIESGHHSTIEHVNFTFAIEGISRACSHQLVRHRIGVAFDQQSQRYVNFKDPQFVIPPSIAKQPEAADAFELLMEQIESTRQFLLSQGIPEEDARFVLPNAATTNLIMTVNLRQLIHMASLRLCTLAQWEIRKLFKDIRKILGTIDPFYYKIITIKCIWNGYCDEQRNSDGHCRIRPYRAKTLFTDEKPEGG